MGDVSKHFSRSEIQCPCGCGFFLIVPVLLYKLELVRSQTGFPLIPTSWCRCPQHNSDEGGSKQSSHMSGEGIDIAYNDIRQLLTYLFWLSHFGFSRVKVYSTHIHADVDQIKQSPWFSISGGIVS